MEEIKSSAKEMTYALRDKAEAKKIRAHQKHARYRSVAASIGGSKTDLLVLKFIAKLRAKV